MRPDLHQVDTLAERMAKELVGKNFKIPKEVKWIVPIVCSPFPEWIPSSHKKWWLYRDIPRVCKQTELLEVISRIKEGKSPLYKLSIYSNKKGLYK